jgi:hypothetical protein
VATNILTQTGIRPQVTCPPKNNQPIINTFLPARHAIAEFATGSTLLVMLLLKIDPYYEGLLLIGVISLILTSVVLLIRDMDNPFEGYATVDLKQLDKFDKYLDAKYPLSH